MPHTDEGGAYLGISKNSIKTIYLASYGSPAPLQIGSCGGEGESRRAELLSPGGALISAGIRPHEGCLRHMKALPLRAHIIPPLSLLCRLNLTVAPRRNNFT